MLGIAGTTVFVTGAARGVGAATARLLGSMGANVVAADINEAGIGQTVSAIEAAGGTARGVTLDVSDEEAVAAAVAGVVDEFGRLDSAVNAAATILSHPIEDTTAVQWNRVMSVNVNGVFNVCKHAIIDFLRHDGGRIVNVASISGQVSLAQQPAYCASKGAVVMLSRQIAADYASRGIRCNTVGPGSIDGEFLDSYLSAQADESAARTSIIAAHPIGRLASPAEIAGPIAFLLSDYASFVVGSNLQVDGGYTAV